MEKKRGIIQPSKQKIYFGHNLYDETVIGIGNTIQVLYVKERMPLSQDSQIPERERRPRNKKRKTTDAFHKIAKDRKLLRGN